MTYEIISSAKNIKRGEFGVIYGLEGCGKTTLTSFFNNSIYIQTKECGLREIDAPCYPATADFSDLMGQLRDVFKRRTAKDDNDFNFNNLIIDTGSSIEQMIYADVFATEKLSDGSHADALEQYGWNRGYELVQKRWMKVVSACKAIADTGMNVVMIFHASVQKFKTPLGQEYNYYNIDITHREGVSSRDFVTRNAEFVLFINIETVSVKKKIGATTKEVAASNSVTPDHIIYCEKRSGFNAKNRHSLDFKYDYTLNNPPVDMIEKIGL